MVYIGDMITHGSAFHSFPVGRSPKYVIQEALSASLCTVLMGMLAQDGLPGRANQVDSTRKNGGFHGI
jgi:hypothetical protein